MPRCYRVEQRCQGARQLLAQNASAIDLFARFTGRLTLEKAELSCTRKTIARRSCPVKDYRLCRSSFVTCLASVHNLVFKSVWSVNVDAVKTAVKQAMSKLVSCADL